MKEVLFVLRRIWILDFVEKVTISGSNNIIEGKTLSENSEDAANAGSHTAERKTVKYVSNRFCVTNNV